MARSKVNFHIHTTYSDGQLDVPEIVAGLHREGVEFFAITDHDSVEGNAAACLEADRLGLSCYHGVELSCCFDGEAGFDSSYLCHIVGLGIDSNKMQIKLNRISDRAHTILVRLVDALKRDGYDISVQSKLGSRTQVAQMLIDKGYSDNISETFVKILNTDEYRGFANTKPYIKDGIDIIHSCGGIAIWAHPLDLARGGKQRITDNQVVRLYDKLRREYDLDGIEVYYHKYDKDQIEFLDRLCRNDSIFCIKSIATDFHAHKPVSSRYNRSSLVFDIDGIAADESIVDELRRRRLG